MMFVNDTPQKGHNLRVVELLSNLDAYEDVAFLQEVASIQKSFLAIPTQAVYLSWEQILWILQKKPNLG